MNYYKRHKEALNTFYNSIDELIEKYTDKKEWIVFGSSRICGMLIAYLDKKGIRVSGIVDNDKKRQGEKAFGIKIYSPDTYLIPKKDNVLIMIASAHQESMINQLENLGYMYEEDIIKVIDLPALMSDFGFEERSEYQKMTIEEVKKCQMDILAYLQEVCQEYNLEYAISGGTLLGAVRHKGYIPWDDDIDVVMKLEDIQKLSEILKDDKRYKLISMFDDELDYFDDCALMVDTNTIMDMNRFPMQSITGVSIDIFLLTGIPDGKEGKEYMLKARELESNCYNTLYSEKECRKNIHKLISYLEEHKFENYNKAGAVLGSYFYREILDREDYEKHVELPFEDRIFWAPIGYKNYLENIFGNYMKLPPIEQQKPHHFFNAYWKNDVVHDI